MASREAVYIYSSVERAVHSPPPLITSGDSLSRGGDSEEHAQNYSSHGESKYLFFHIKHIKKLLASHY